MCAELSLADLMRDWEQTETAVTLYNEILAALESGVSDDLSEHTLTETSADKELVIRMQRADVRFNLGGLHKEQGDYVAAVAEYNEGLATLGLSVETETEKEFRDNGESDSDRDTGEDVSAAMVASQSQLLMARGIATAKLGDGQDSANVSANAEAGLVDMRASLALQPRAMTHNAMGNILKRVGREEEAEQSYMDAIALDENFAVAHYNLGALLHTQGKLDEATGRLQSASALDAEYSLPVVTLGDIAMGRGDVQDAIDYYAAAYQLTPNHKRVKEVPRSLAKLGLGMLRAGSNTSKLQDAKHSLETAHKLKPPKNPMTAHPAMAVAQTYAQEIGRALKVIERKGPRTQEKCAKHKTCDKCRKAACAWCVSRSSCDLDEEMRCESAKDHIGMAGPMGQLQCPSSQHP